MRDWDWPIIGGYAIAALVLGVITGGLSFGAIALIDQSRADERARFADCIERLDDPAWCFDHALRRWR